VAEMDRRTYGTAIPASWIVMWLLLAALEGRWLRAPTPRTWASIAARGAAAAVLGGVAFYLVMNVLWGAPPVTGRNYLVQFLAWAFAWAPGLAVLTYGRPRAVDASRTAIPGASDSARSASRDHERAESRDGVAAADVDRSISGIELLARIDKGEAVLVLDVRSEMEFAAGRVPGAVNVPFNLVPFRMDEVPGAPGDELIVYCGHGPRAYMAAIPLRHPGGRRVVFMSGHWSGWQSAGLRVETD
jgi:rhodanese-related sulfurtransferase